MTDSALNLANESLQGGDSSERLLCQRAVSQTIERLRRLAQFNLQGQWHVCAEDLPLADALRSGCWQRWPIAAVNEREHVAWPAERQVLWLSQQWIMPEDLQGYPLKGLALRLALVWWAEDAQIFVNGHLVQRGDLFDCYARFQMSAAVEPGERFAIALRLVSPGHDPGALVKSMLCFESLDRERPDPSFVADELATLQGYLTQFWPEQLESVASAIGTLDWSRLADRDAFDDSLVQLRQRLHPLGQWLQQRQLRLVSHAHLDMAWLWPVSETWDVAERTFQSVLNLQQDFPHLTFSHSTAALYDWLERHRPELFTLIQQRATAGTWEVAAGLWVEPELQLVSGESITRQVLYGQRYMLEKFGQLCAVAWLPDSFGFCWQLPQILKQGGIDYFATQKLGWNDTTEFPHQVFWWRAPDGTQIFSLTLPPIGQDTDPIKMADYARTWEAKTQVKTALWLPGVGDHGGGPSREMLERVERWQQSLYFPNIEFTTATAYLQQIEALLGNGGGTGDGEGEVRQKAEGRGQKEAEGVEEAGGMGNGERGIGNQDESREERQLTINNQPLTINNQPLPVWDDELYLEFHRGCYTSHADQKRWNRRCEQGLYQAELFASLASLQTRMAYPKAALEDAWKRVLFNQFHDILPGSAIPEVFVDANRDWQAAAQVAEQVLERSLAAIASHIALPAPPHPDCQPIIIFNPLNWQRSDVVVLSLPAGSKPRVEPTDKMIDWQVYDLAGNTLPTQKQQSATDDSPTLLFLATDIPSVGYRLFWLRAIAIDPPHPTPHTPHPTEDFVLENECLRVVVDPQTGDLSSVFDKQQQREILSGPGNQLQAWHDRPGYWDAWNIATDYADHPLPPAALTAIAFLEHGPIQHRLRITRQIGQSTFQQDYILQTHSSLLKIETTANWQERHVLVKATFPLALDTDRASYEMPYGTIQRPTRPRTADEKAKWEVPALHWADLTAEIPTDPTTKSNREEWGASLLNDCKHGYDSQPDRLRLTLLKGPKWPDPEADKGYHHFTYALYPHAGNWQAAHTVKRGYELNLPLQIIQLPVNNRTQNTVSLPPSASLLTLSADNLILTAFKPAEDDPHSCPKQWILRCYECHGEPAQLQGNLVTIGDRRLSCTTAQPVDLLERPTAESGRSTDGQNFSLAPWKIATFRLNTADEE